jgi:phenylacetic acid degradation operon negative regulatory protein
MSRAGERLTARSVILSVLLGVRPASATQAELIRLTSDFDIKEPTMRVALTRMVRSGDLVQSVGGYRLSDRLLARQRRQDDAMRPLVRVWRGTWTMLVITTVGVDPRARADTRKELQYYHFAELREGVWLRPDNLKQDLSADLEQRVRVLHAHDDAPVELANVLWNLPSWAQTGRELLEELESASDGRERFVIAAAIIRHLMTDPVLPNELLPADWPGDSMRTAYAEFAADIADRRYQAEVGGGLR